MTSLECCSTRTSQGRRPDGGNRVRIALRVCARSRPVAVMARSCFMALFASQHSLHRVLSSCIGRVGAKTSRHGTLEQCLPLNQAGVVSAMFRAAFGLLAIALPATGASASTRTGQICDSTRFDVEYSPWPAAGRAAIEALASYRFDAPPGTHLSLPFRFHRYSVLPVVASLAWHWKSLSSGVDSWTSRQGTATVAMVGGRFEALLTDGFEVIALTRDIPVVRIESGRWDPIR